MNFDWRYSIKRFISEDAESFDHDFCGLVGIICRQGFFAGNFGFETWNAAAIQEMSREILNDAMGPALLQHFAACDDWGDGRWNNYFVSVIRNHLIDVLRKKGKAPLSIDDIEIGQEDQEIETFEMRKDAEAFCGFLLERQRIVLRGMCEDSTLKDIAKELGNVRKSTVFNEKRTIIIALSKLQPSAAWMKHFLSILCAVINSFLEKQKADAEGK